MLWLVKWLICFALWCIGVNGDVSHGCHTLLSLGRAVILCYLWAGHRCWGHVNVSLLRLARLNIEDFP
jgi:hypothetical protein